MTTAATAVLGWFADNFRTIVGLLALASSYALVNAAQLGLTPAEIVIVGFVPFVLSQTDPNRDHVTPPAA
jgi:hypothetical protein